MAQQNQQAGKPKRGGARTAMLGGLLAIIAVIAAWLSNCIPGFGIGSGTGEGEGDDARTEPAQRAEPESETEKKTEQPANTEQPKPEQPSVTKPMPIKLTVDPRGCSVDGDEPIDCATLCDQSELFEGRDTVIIDAKNGPHGVVVDVLDCLKSKDLAVSITRK
jgi:hypothetical protein